MFRKLPGPKHRAKTRSPPRKGAKKKRKNVAKNHGCLIEPQKWQPKLGHFWSKKSFSHYVFAGFVHIGWINGVQLSTRQHIYIYIFFFFHNVWAIRANSLKTCDLQFLARRSAIRTKGAREVQPWNDSRESGYLCESANRFARIGPSKNLTNLLCFFFFTGRCSHFCS